VFSPKVFVTYKGLEEILNDRSINIVMIRTDNKEIADSEIDEFDSKWEKLRNILYIFALHNWKKIQKMYKELPEMKGIHSRARELWRPILVLAKFFGNDIFEEIWDLALTRIKESEAEEEIETREMILLATLKEMVTEDGFYAIVDIQRKITELFNEEYSRDWIGTALARKLGFREAKRLARQGRPTARKLTVNKINVLAKKHGLKAKWSKKTVQVVQAVQKTNKIGQNCEICNKNPGALILRNGIEHFICEKCQINWEGNL